MEINSKRLIPCIEFIDYCEENPAILFEGCEPFSGELDMRHPLEEWDTLCEKSELQLYAGGLSVDTGLSRLPNPSFSDQ